MSTTLQTTLTSSLKYHQFRKLPVVEYAHDTIARSNLHEAETYLTGAGEGGGGSSWSDAFTTGSSDSFRRAVDNVLVPYAKAVGAEGKPVSADKLRFSVAATGTEDGRVNSARVAELVEKGIYEAAAHQMGGSDSSNGTDEEEPEE